MISQANRGVQCVASNVRCGERGLRGQSLPIRSRFAFLIVANVFRRSTKLTSILTFGFSLMSVSVASMALSFGWQNGATALAASSRRPRRAASFLSRQVPPPVARMKRGLDSGPRLPRWAGPVPRTEPGPRQGYPRVVASANGPSLTGPGWATPDATPIRRDVLPCPQGRRYAFVPRCHVAEIFRKKRIDQKSSEKEGVDQNRLLHEPSGALSPLPEIALPRPNPGPHRSMLYLIAFTAFLFVAICVVMLVAATADWCARSARYAHMSFRK